MKLSEEALGYLQENNDSALEFLNNEKTTVTTFNINAVTYEAPEARQYLLPVIEKQLKMHTEIKEFLNSLTKE